MNKITKNNKQEKKTGFSPILGIGIIIVITVLAVDAWLVYYHNTTTSQPAINQLLITTSADKARSSKKVAPGYNISGSIKAINENGLIITQKDNEIIINLVSDTKYYQLKFITVNNQPKLQQTLISKADLKASQKVTIQTEENTKKAGILTARKIEVLP